MKLDDHFCHDSYTSCHDMKLLQKSTITLAYDDTSSEEDNPFEDAPVPKKRKVDKDKSKQSKTDPHELKQGNAARRAQVTMI